MVSDVRKVDFNSGDLKQKREPISIDQIVALKTKKGGYRRHDLAALGVPFPPPKGWIDALLKFGYPLFSFEHVASEYVNPKFPKKKSKIQKVVEERRRERAVRIVASKIERAAATPPQKNKAEFYKSWEWRTLRMEILKEYGAVCMCCGATPKHKGMDGEPAKIVVDHIKPLHTHWHLRLSRENLQVLCDECNQGKGAWDQTDHRPSSAPDEWIIEDEIPEALREQLSVRH